MNTSVGDDRHGQASCGCTEGRIERYKVGCGVASVNADMPIVSEARSKTAAIGLKVYSSGGHKVVLVNRSCREGGDVDGR